MSFLDDLADFFLETNPVTGPAKKGAEEAVDLVTPDLPPVEPAPMHPGQDEEQRRREEEAARREREAQRRGRASTILTGAAGDISEPFTARRTLLGA